MAQPLVQMTKIPTFAWLFVHISLMDILSGTQFAEDNKRNESHGQYLQVGKKK
jgi:hypothetical protein